MAFKTGQATDYADLLEQLVAFVTDPTQMGQGNAWTALRHIAGDQAILEGPGSSGTDGIVVGAQLFHDDGGQYYNWRLLGATGFDTNQPFANQPGAMTGPVLPLWNAGIGYWFVASARRIIVVAQVSTVFVTAYLGFLDSYATPDQYPYPLVVGGSLAFPVGGNMPPQGDQRWRWSYTGQEMSSCWIGDAPNYVPPGDQSWGQLRLRRADGTWEAFAGNQNGGPQDPQTWGSLNNNNPAPQYGDNKVLLQPLGMVWPYAARLQNLRVNIDGSVPLFPIVLASATPDAHGELDAVYAVSGSGLGAGQTIAVGGTNYLVVQDVFRTTRESYCAVRLS